MMAIQTQGNTIGISKHIYSFVRNGVSMRRRRNRQRLTLRHDTPQLQSFCKHGQLSQCLDLRMRCVTRNVVQCEENVGATLSKLSNLRMLSYDTFL